MSREDEILRKAQSEDPLYGLEAEQRAMIEAWCETEVRRERERTKAESRKRRYLERELTRALQQYDEALTIQYGECERPAMPPVRATKKARSPAAAILMWSDHHVDHHITPDTTTGLNEYTLEIAWQRFRALIQRTIWQIKTWQEASKLDTIVVAALGDWIAGDIHEEYRSTSLAPQEATRIVREMHEWGLEQLHRLRSIKQIQYVGLPDNHGRTTRRNHWVDGHERSHNWGLYHALKAVCDKGGLSKLHFTISKGSVIYVDVMGHKFRLMHGHQFNYGGGVGGISIPGNKYVQRSDKGVRADYTLIGHYHQARDFGSLIVNGSLCGPDAYSVARGFDPEPPIQLALLVRPEFGVCDISRIFPVPREGKS